MHDSDQLALLHWLAQASLHGADEASILVEGSRRLRAAGLAVDRSFAGVELIHPLVEGEIYTWDAETDTLTRTGLDRFEEDESDWLVSPLHHLHESGASMLRRRVGDSYRRGEFPLVDSLVDRGVTDYLAFVGRFSGHHAIGERDETFLTFASRRPGGFRDDEVALLQRLVFNMLVAIRAATGRRMAYAMMECYLGRDAGRRVLRGGIDRGHAESIDAVLWFSDLRGFTRLADTMAPDAIIPMLNGYADCQASAVTRHGGEVLKFMGDGVLAIFPHENDGAGCEAALDAAVDAFAAVGRVNDHRARQGLPATTMYLGLHVGRVLYGNIGSAERLDFTVVGPAVNEVNRIAGMCGPLEKEVLISDAFAQAAPQTCDRMAALGRYALRGVRTPQALFTLDPDHPAHRPAAGQL